MAAWSPPVEAWLKPAPEPGLRRKDSDVDTVPDISVVRYLMFHYRPRPDSFARFLVRVQAARTGSNQFAVFVPLDDIVVPH